jgi:hypothetical protein
METNTFDSPQALINYLVPHEEKMRTPSALGSWYWRAKLWFDPNVCGCKKKNMSLQQIEDGYRNMVNWPEGEKSVARNIAGCSFTIIMNGVTLGTI